MKNKVFLTFIFALLLFASEAQNIRHDQLQEPEVERSDSLLFFITDEDGYWRIGKEESNYFEYFTISDGTTGETLLNTDVKYFKGNDQINVEWVNNDTLKWSLKDTIPVKGLRMWKDSMYIPFQFPDSTTLNGATLIYENDTIKWSAKDSLFYFVNDSTWIRRGDSVEVDTGTGDMLKADYDDNNDGTVNNADSLGGVPASGYDNYNNWDFAVNGTGSGTIFSGNELNFISSDEITLSSSFSSGQYNLDFGVDLSDYATQTWVTTNFDNYDYWQFTANTGSGTISSTNEIYFNGGTDIDVNSSFSSGVYTLTFDYTGSGGSMIYPNAGIAVSTGSSWGTSITDNSSEWNTAYSDKINSISVTGTDTKTITLTQQDGTTLSDSFTDLQGSGAVSSVNAGNLIDVSSTTGDVTVDVDLSEATSDNTFVSTDKLIYLSGTTHKQGTVSGLESYMQSNLNFDSEWDSNADNIYTTRSVTIGASLSGSQIFTVTGSKSSTISVFSNGGTSTALQATSGGTYSAYFNQKIKVINGIDIGTTEVIDGSGNVSSANGATGTFESADGKTITVTDGIITGIN